MASRLNSFAAIVGLRRRGFTGKLASSDACVFWGTFLARNSIKGCTEDVLRLSSLSWGHVDTSCSVVHVAHVYCTVFGHASGEQLRPEILAFNCSNSSLTREMQKTQYSVLSAQSLQQPSTASATYMHLRIAWDLLFHQPAGRFEGHP
jgi:hypothetical protein